MGSTSCRSRASTSAAWSNTAANCSVNLSKSASGMASRASDATCATSSREMRSVMRRCYRERFLAPSDFSRRPAVRPLSPTLPTVEKHAFLSPEWIDAALAIRDEYASHLPEPPAPVRMNLLITDAPDGGDDIHASIDTGESGLLPGSATWTRRSSRCGWISRRPGR